MRYTLPIAAAVAALFSLPAGATSFSGYNMNLVGTANMQGSDLQLINNVGQVSAAWLNTPLSTANNFTAFFGFSLTNTVYNPMADGIAFVLQNQGTSAVGLGGGNVGYNGLNGVGSIVQSWGNNTAGLNTDGNAYNTKAAPANLGYAKLVTGSEMVSYNASTNTLSMQGIMNVDGNNYFISDTAHVNLAAKFGSTMDVGFTGGSGASGADERITSFNIAAVPEPSEYALMAAGLGLMGFMVRRKKSA